MATRQRQRAVPFDTLPHAKAYALNLAAFHGTKYRVMVVRCDAPAYLHGIRFAPVPESEWGSYSADGAAWLTDNDGRPITFDPPVRLS